MADVTIQTLAAWESQHAQLMEGMDIQPMPYSGGAVVVTPTLFGGGGVVTPAPAGAGGPPPTSIDDLPIAEAAGPLAVIPAALGALGLTLPGWLAAIIGVAGAGYGAYQALGGGEGGGLFGLNVLGGDEFTTGGVEFGGPGLPEPKAPYKEWSVTINGTRLQFYRVSTPRGTKMFCYNTKTKKWSHWIPQKMAVIGKNLPTHRTLVRLRRNLKKHTADARTILKLTAPKSLKEAKRRR